MKPPILSRDGIFGVTGWALIDEEDISLVSPHKWNMSGNYAYSPTGGWMHRLALGMPRKRTDMSQPLCDHINRNTLDNRKSNLRSASHAENMRNRSPKMTRKKYVANVDFP